MGAVAPQLACILCVAAERLHRQWIGIDITHLAIGLIERWLKGYFYCHQIVGYLLASFLVAGLAGLTKKNP
jgi:hypothetical protein